jgi:hypothetical protein
MWILDAHNLYNLLRDLGGFFAGIFALVAGGLAYRAGQNQADATREQIAVDVKKDRAQAHALAVAVYPEIILVKADIERIMAIIKDKYETGDGEKDISDRAWLEKDTVLEFILTEPPLIRENSHWLFVMEKTGATIFELLGTILQYNRKVETLAIHLTDGSNSPGLMDDLEKMRALVSLAGQKIAAILDQA